MRNENVAPERRKSMATSSREKAQYRLPSTNFTPDVWCPEAHRRVADRRGRISASLLVTLVYEMKKQSILSVSRPHKKGRFLSKKSVSGASTPRSKRKVERGFQIRKEGRNPNGVAHTHTHTAFCDRLPSRPCESAHIPVW